MIPFVPGFLDDKEKFDLTVLLTRILFPYLACMSLMAAYGAILNSLEPLLRRGLRAGDPQHRQHRGADPAGDLRGAGAGERDGLGRDRDGDRRRRAARDWCGGR